MNRFFKTVSVAIAGAALTLGGTLSANALTINPNPIVENQAFTVTSSNSLPAGDYKVSICSKETWSFFGQEVPACAKGVGVKIDGFEGGILTTTISGINRNTPNAHAFMFRQPDTLDCEEYHCEVIIAYHKSLFKKEKVERGDFTFASTTTTR